ncbi:MAG: hypothetical protein MRY21_05920 [Simkaniaceae bacterium]|nr:hypothetical protein [Simkaniaceae bacterium]
MDTFCINPEVQLGASGVQSATFSDVHRHLPFKRVHKLDYRFKATELVSRVQQVVSELTGWKAHRITILVDGVRLPSSAQIGKAKEITFISRKSYKKRRASDGSIDVCSLLFGRRHSI